MQKHQKILLSLTLISLFALLIISNNIEPKHIFISNITYETLNQQITIEAKIVSLRTFQNQSFQILSLKDSTGKIDATTNSKTPLKINYSQEYAIQGKISEYNKTLQININKIRPV